MNIAFIIGHLPESADGAISGQKRTAINLIQNFKRNYPHKIVIFGLDKSSNILFTLFSFKNKNTFVRDLLVIRTGLINLIISSLKYDFVINTTHVFFSSLSILLKKLLLKKTSVLHLSPGLLFKERMIAGNEPGKPGLFAVWLEKFTFCYADSIITTSHLAGEEIKNWVKTANVKVIQFGVDLKAFSHINNSKKQQANSGQKIKIMSVASFYRIKGLDLLLRALENVDESCELLIAGDGLESYKNELLNFIHNSPKLNKHQIKFLGQISSKELAEIYKNVDLYIQPSRFDVFPNAVLEAMHIGLPIILTEGVGSNSMFGSQTNGIICTKINSEDIAEKINQILLYKEELKLMGDRNKNIIKETSWEKIINDLIDSVCEY